jgi:hypothetical protein
VHLRDVAGGPGAEDALADIREGLDSAAAVRAELAVVFRADFALGDLLDMMSMRCAGSV